MFIFKLFEYETNIISSPVTNSLCPCAFHRLCCMALVPPGYSIGVGKAPPSSLRRQGPTCRSVSILFGNWVVELLSTVPLCGPRPLPVLRSNAWDLLRVRTTPYLLGTAGLQAQNVTGNCHQVRTSLCGSEKCAFGTINPFKRGLSRTAKSLVVTVNRFRTFREL